jgi:WXXGXW repeat (2 copies)
MNIKRIFTGTVGTAMLASALLLAPRAAQAGVFVSVGIAPPLIPVYSQPLCPGDGYIWTPGYWAYGDSGYYWVDGAWVLAPYVGALWTPGYWGWGGGFYNWYPGYWGRRVGYYGGINYGYGYFGSGFYGGYWGGRHFFYNRGYNNINITNIHNVYNRPVNGFSGHPGGSSFTHVSGGHFADNRGAGFNGREGNFNRGPQNFTGNNHSSYGGFGNSQVNSNLRENLNARAYSGNPGGAQMHSFAQPSYGGGHSFTAQAAPHGNFGGGGSFQGGGGRSFSGGGGGSFSGAGGGGFHGGGGGGGFHGGGGGGGFHGGGGGGGHR